MYTFINFLLVLWYFSRFNVRNVLKMRGTFNIRFVFTLVAVVLYFSTYFTLTQVLVKPFTLQFLCSSNVKVQGTQHWSKLHYWFEQVRKDTWSHGAQSSCRSQTVQTIVQSIRHSWSRKKNTSYHLLVTEYSSGFNQNVCNESEDIGIQESVCVLFHHHLKLKMKFTADHMDKEINFQGKVLWWWTKNRQ